MINLLGLGSSLQSEFSRNLRIWSMCVKPMNTGCFWTVSAGFSKAFVSRRIIMKRVWITTLTVCTFLCLCSLGFGQGFDLQLSGDTILSGQAEDVVSGSCIAILAPDGSEGGAEGWQISLTADNATITGISIVGMDAEALFSGGFQISQTTPACAIDPVTGMVIMDKSTGNCIEGGPGAGDCVGLDGAVSAVILSEESVVTLPVGSPSSIAILSVEATIPAGGGTATVRYVDSCQGGGQPISNTISVDGQTRFPTLGSKTINLIEVVRNCEGKNSVGFSEDFVRDVADWVDILGVPSDFSDPSELCVGQGSVIKEGPAGGTVQGSVYVNIIEAKFDRAQGWSFSIELSGDSDFNLTNVTTNGTVAAPNQLFEPDGVTPCLGANSFPNCVRQDPSNPGLWSGGFNSTGIIETNKEILAVEKCPEDGTDPFTGDSCESGSDLEILMEDPVTGNLIREARFVICPKDGVDPISGGSCNPGDIVIAEIVNVDRRGLVSAVVLSLTLPVTLGAGTSSVLKISYEGVVADGGGAGTGPVACLGFVDGLIGDGQPVGNIVTIAGNAGDVTNFDLAEVCFGFTALSVLPFQRGNSNDDLKLNIADAIYTINWRFQNPAGPAPACEDAADANDDGVVDITDAAVTLGNLFMNEPLPTDASNFFPACAIDPSDITENPDALTCLSSSACEGL